jgi:hypothetical protein
MQANLALARRRRRVAGTGGAVAGAEECVERVQMEPGEVVGLNA